MIKSVKVLSRCFPLEIPLDSNWKNEEDHILSLKCFPPRSTVESMDRPNPCQKAKPTKKADSFESACIPIPRAEVKRR